MYRDQKKRKEGGARKGAREQALAPNELIHDGGRRQPHSERWLAMTRDSFVYPEIVHQSILFSPFSFPD